MLRNALLSKHTSTLPLLIPRYRFIESKSRSKMICKRHSRKDVAGLQENVHNCQTQKLFEGMLEGIGPIIIQQYQILMIHNLPYHRITLRTFQSSSSLCMIMGDQIAFFCLAQTKLSISLATHRAGFWTEILNQTQFNLCNCTPSTD